MYDCTLLISDIWGTKVASKSYNGWAGKTRSLRHSQFKRLRSMGKFPKRCECQMCGDSDEGRKGFGFHAEEYGDFIDDYLRNCYYLCAGCHALLHVRFRFPNRWNRYRFTILSGMPRRQVNHMGEVFGKISHMIDIPSFPVQTLGNWSDVLTCVEYKGEERIAQKRVLYHETGEIVTMDEPWVGIDLLELHLDFDFNTMGTGNETKK